MIGVDIIEPKVSAVGNTECTAGQIFDSDFAVFCFFRVINNCLFDVGNAHLVGITQDWYNQTAWGCPIAIPMSK